jgi:hypothetical protein
MALTIRFMTTAIHIAKYTNLVLENTGKEPLLRTLNRNGNGTCAIPAVPVSSCHGLAARHNAREREPEAASRR